MDALGTASISHDAGTVFSPDRSAVKGRSVPSAQRGSKQIVSLW